MAQDVFSKMAQEPTFLRDDGCTDLSGHVKKLVYHPTLNVILVCSYSGVVRVFDISSGVVIHSTCPTSQYPSEIICRFIPGPNRILFSDGYTIGARSDYNGAILLDTILQKPTSNVKDNIKLELLFPEALLLKQCLTGFTATGVDEVLNELNNKISESQKLSKDSIKAQKWSTVCLDLPLEPLRSVVNSRVCDFLNNHQHTPEIGIASTVYSRLAELAGEHANASDRRAMATEANRRETFSSWPHMDYKWALPNQMALAGFYHQPNAAGDDRAMCFTCAVCLVCWEKTDEPWGEHERHSPTCPFVMGEYTQNVPISVTYATNSAIDATRLGSPLNVIGTSSVAGLIPTSNDDGLITVFDVSERIKKTISFFVTQFDSLVLEKLTQDYGGPGMWTDNHEVKFPADKEITALSLLGEKLTTSNITIANKNVPSSTVRPTIICGISVNFCSSREKSSFVETLNDQNKSDQVPIHIMEVDEVPLLNEYFCLYLIVYDYQYTKEIAETETESNADVTEVSTTNTNPNVFKDPAYTSIVTFSLVNDSDSPMMNDTNVDMGSSNAADDMMMFPSGKTFKFVQKYPKDQLKMYQNFIPGDSDEIFIPHTLTSQNHTGPRGVHAVDPSEPDSAQAPSLIIPTEYSFMNGHLGSSPVDSLKEKSISDHITELQKDKHVSRLGISRAVQCFSLPDPFKNEKDLKVSDIIPTSNGSCILVVLKSISGATNGALIIYSLNFSDKMVKVNEEPILIRKLGLNENPVEISVHSKIGRLKCTKENNDNDECHGFALLVGQDGAVRIIELCSLTTLNIARLDEIKFTSAVICPSVERIVASSDTGMLFYFALNDYDSDSLDDQEDEENSNMTSQSAASSAHCTASMHDAPATCFNEQLELSTSELKRLYDHCSFEPLESEYCVVVAPCWSEMQQAQRQRRHPHLKIDGEQHIKTFRLQTDTTTWDEHVFELMLPTPTYIGHVDVHFSLHSSTVLPNVEITLLKQNCNNKQRRGFKFQVDDQVNIDALHWTDNPVISDEYLQTHNADILAGPIDVVSCLDMTDQSGCVTLTSPKLLKTRVRTLFLHVKSVYSKENGKMKYSNSFKCKKSEGRSATSSPLEKGASQNQKNEFYMGCDCLHEISIAIYSSNTTDIPQDRLERHAMLESNYFVRSLCTTAISQSNMEKQNLTLDILTWVASIRLARNRSFNGQPPPYQIEFLKIIESNLASLLRNCLLLANRSLSHKCVKLMIICTAGAKNINELLAKTFESSLLNILLVLLESIDQVQSSASLQWFLTLLINVTNTNDAAEVSIKCIKLLEKLSDELVRRTNPYHLLLRTRYGLYGTPLESELFDIEPPPSIKSTSTVLTYATAVSGGDSSPTSQNNDFHTNYAFNKEALDPKEVLSMSKGDGKIKLKSVASTKIVKGLLETEPLHFTCISASEGTRVERADLNSAFSNNLIPITVSTPQTQSSGTKKVELDQLVNEMTETAYHFNTKLMNGGQPYPNIVDCQIILQGDSIKSDDLQKILSDTIEISMDSDSSSMTSEPRHKAAFTADQILPQHHSLPWQQLLTVPLHQVIVVERMHSGARRFVTLDFGHSVLLTDILIPMCQDLVSVSVDIWNKGEDVDAIRLVIATDIGTRNLVMNDLQPPPLCRYLKITVVGRYGMSTTKCRIPIGYFYGHLVTLSESTASDQARPSSSSSNTDLENQLNVLSMLLEDVNCRYSLACTKLKDLLNPFLTSSISNAAHLQCYMNIMKESVQMDSSSDNAKIFSAYQESVTYQRQLNTVRNVMCRIENSLFNSTRNIHNGTFSEACSDKLRCIIETLLEALLTIDSIPQLDVKTCRNLFQGLCVSQSSRIQLLAATMLVRSCGKQPFWGSFLAETMKEMYSSSYSSKFPQDRLFVLLTFLGRRSIERSSVLDATLKVLNEVLLPLISNRQPLLAACIDLPLLGWLLLFLSLQLDMNKVGIQSANRWDWVTGELTGKLTETVGNCYRKKIQKKVLQYKQQIESLDWTHKVVQSSTQALSALSSHAASLTSKLEAALKHQEHLLKKMKHYKTMSIKNESFDNSKQGKRRHEQATENSNNSKVSPVTSIQHFDPAHCLVVAKGLIAFLISMDHSCSADMFLLASKVVARLISLAKLRLGQLMNEKQLLRLVYVCINTEIPWAPHALACMLQDILEVGKPTESFFDMETDAPPPSTSWHQADILSDMDLICATIALPDIMEPATKQGKSSPSVSNQLPSVYESDDSELEDFLDDILERGRNALKKSSKPSAPSFTYSTAFDSRLEVGVESNAELTLRRIVSLNAYNLLQNVNLSPPYADNKHHEYFSWPNDLLNPWQLDQQLSKTNEQMMMSCFNNLCKEMSMTNPLHIEHIMQLWLNLNCSHGDDKFDPSLVPSISLEVDSVRALISTIVWSPGLSLRSWCSILQSLTLLCNISQERKIDEDIVVTYPIALFIINLPDFENMLLKLLSGTGLVFIEKGLAGPSLCKALHDFLVRMHTRCDVISPTSAAGITIKNLHLTIVYHLVQPSGAFASKHGPLDAQCKYLQSISILDFSNCDVNIVTSMFENTSLLVQSYISYIERIKCINIGERLNGSFNIFSGIFASVLGSDTAKQDRPATWDILLISLLKLLTKLVQTPLPGTEMHQQEAMETETAGTSQTDESKVEQIQQERSGPPVPCLADNVLQQNHSIINFCQSLSVCKASSLSMLANISQQSAFADLGEPGTVGDAVFHILATLARKTSQKEYIMEPLLQFLQHTSQLSEPLLWFILQVLDTEESLNKFLLAGGVGVIGRSLVESSNAPNTISHASTVSMVMQHFSGSTARSDASTAIASASTTKKIQQANLENTMSLINFAPIGTIKCDSRNAQPADILIQGGAATHRRARTAQWTYHFYPEETYVELVIQLPSAVLLREVHLQPHLSSLATCPAAVALEVSSSGLSRLVPACPPLPTSGMTFIRLHLPVPEVVNCVLLRLYKPRDANNIGLSQIRLLGTSAFGAGIKQQVLDLSEEESHCKYSLGWLRLLHHCFTLPTNDNFKKQVVESAAQVPDLLPVCCGLLLVPTYIPGLYLPNLEKVLCELSLHNRQNGMNVIEMLLESKTSISDPLIDTSSNHSSGHLFNSGGIQSACELLYQICGHQDPDNLNRIVVLLKWLQRIGQYALRNNDFSACNPAYFSSIASILWVANETSIASNLRSIIDVVLFDLIYVLNKKNKTNLILKRSLDSLMCSLCYIKIEFFSYLLQLMGILVINLSTDHNASICDDRKDSESMIDDTKQHFELTADWYGKLVIADISDMDLMEDYLETIALVARSPNAIQQLLDSGLPKKLSLVIYEFCKPDSNDNSTPKCETVVAILKFFVNISDEQVMRNWLGSSEGSLFWLPLLQWLCKRPVSKNRSHLRSDLHSQLEEVFIRFLAKCCLCHSNNQLVLAKILCDVIMLQRNGISGFMRRLILQLLLENEKIPIDIKADDTIYKNTMACHTYMPNHPALKQTHNQALLYLSINTTLADIIEQHISFSTGVESLDTPNGVNKKECTLKCETFKNWGWSTTLDSDLSMAAGVTAKDKRAKDAKNQATATPQFKKKKYSSSENSPATDIIDGRSIRCEFVSDQPLPISLTLGQVLKMVESKGIPTDWPCLHLNISQSKGHEEKSSKIEAPPGKQAPLSSSLQVFSSIGGLALLAQHLPAIYPETIRAAATAEKPSTSSEQIEADWVKLDAGDDIYEDIEEISSCGPPQKSASVLLNVPTHSLTAFGLFLRLPGYAEVLLKDMKKASCLLRLVLGVTDDGEGGDIFQSSIADSLPTLPFEVLRQLYDSTPLSTDDGRLLRRISVNNGVVHLLLACLSIFTHQAQNNNDKEGKDKETKTKDERTQLYWAKGTGFGTGSTQQSWNVEQALLKQRNEEEHVTVLLLVFASYINPKGEAADELIDNVLPHAFYQMLANSALLPVLSSYLRNDSVLDMARHIPLYRAVLKLLRALAVSSQLISLLVSPKAHSGGPSVGALLGNMKTCVDTYASKLKLGKKTSSSAKFVKNNGGEPADEQEREEGLAQLMPDIVETANLVKSITDNLEEQQLEITGETTLERPILVSMEERYLTFMKKLQFDTFEMIEELPEGGYKFVIAHNFESNARTTGDQSHPSRVKRLAQEAVTLATSLPLSYSSSVFVRCDADRLDVMKVLITGPADTPYANGCFEFDVFFPADYPLTPMLINLVTTGYHSIRFNPNLYNDGKVCLSILNTWHGRPEEKWNAQASSFLQVLVSIQSLILVSEPYFNEPGYERSRGTPSGTQSSKEYNQNICQATVRWAMLEQLLIPCPCFKDIIDAHFYFKRDEIIAQVEEWIKESESMSTDKRLPRTTGKRASYSAIETFKKTFEDLKEKLNQLKPPDNSESSPSSTETMTASKSSNINKPSSSDNRNQEEIDTDIEMEKMVEEMCE